MKRIQSLKNTLGPGILFASTAIGVSHLVQSTKAGAMFGFGLLWAVIAANVLKYPFFEFGSRYANATGTSIIEGYQKLSKWALWTYFIITISSMFFVCAAVGKVTTGFMENLFHLDKIGLSSSASNILVFVVCGGILIIGKFKILDKLIKLIGIVLLLSTFTAFVLCLFHGPINKSIDLISEQSISRDAWFFLIPLMGWMPTAVDLSSWNSLWTVEKIKSSNYHPALKETLFEFNFGYVISGILSICFVTLGAFLIYGTSEIIEKSSDMFAHQIVNLYTKIFGGWSYLIIASSTFSIMFGTCIAVFDGYGRVLNKTTDLLFPKHTKTKNKYSICILILIIGTFLITYQFDKSGDFGILVNFATSISFLIAPIIAIFNYLVVNRYLDNKFTPPKWLNYLSIIGVLYLILFSILYLFKNYLFT